MDVSPSRAGSSIDNIRSRMNVAVTQLTTAHQATDHIECQILNQNQQIDHLLQLQNQALRKLDLQKNELDIYYISMSKMQERLGKTNKVIFALQEQFTTSNDLIEALKNDMAGVNGTLHDHIEALGKANEKTLALELQISHMRAGVMEHIKNLPESRRDIPRTAHPSGVEKLGQGLATTPKRSTMTNGKENTRRGNGGQEVNDSFTRFPKHSESTAYRSNNENLNISHYQTLGQDDDLSGRSEDWPRTPPKAKVTLNPTSAPFTPSNSATKDTKPLQPTAALHRPTMVNHQQAEKVLAIKPPSMSSNALPPHLRGLTQSKPKEPALEQRPELSTSTPLQQITNGVKQSRAPALAPDRKTAPPHQNDPSQDHDMQPPRPKNPKAPSHEHPSTPPQSPPKSSNLIDLNNNPTPPTPPPHSNPAAFIKQYNTLLTDFKTKWSGPPTPVLRATELHPDSPIDNNPTPGSTEAYPHPTNPPEIQSPPPYPKTTKKTKRPSHATAIPPIATQDSTHHPSGPHALGEIMDPATRALVVRPHRGNQWIELDLAWRPLQKGGSVVFVL